MSILKKIGAPLAAVALVAVMGVSLIASPRVAEAAPVTGTVATPATATIWNNQTIPTLTPFSVTITEPSAAAWAAADTIAITHTGLTSTAVTCSSNCTQSAVGANTTTVAITGVSAGIDTITISTITIGVTASGAPASFAATIPGAVTVGTFTSERLVIGSANSTGTPTVLNRVPASFSADSNAAGGALCAAAATAGGALEVSLPVTFTVSLGVVSTGSAKSTTVLTGSNGTNCTNYRGGGGIATTDTAIASNSSQNLVSTLSITLTSPTGNTASKLSITAPQQLAVSATQTNVSPGYVSPTTATTFSVQVTDSAGLGVNGQVILVSVDKGSLSAGFGNTCGSTSKAVTATSANGALTQGSSESKAGVVQLTYCGNETDAAGQATITASNITTSMANVTATVSTAGRPAKVEAKYENGTITATVTDAAGNKVADNTPVQFTISQNAGAVSNTCNLTSNGVASSAVSLNSGSGSVIVSAGYNENGTAANCTQGQTGAKTVSTVVNIGPGGSTSTGGGAGAGTFAAAPVFSAAKGGSAQAVFNGGSVAQLEAAVVAAKGTGVWAQDSTGKFVVYIINGGFVNDAFKAAFPNGFAGVTAVTVVN